MELERAVYDNGGYIILKAGAKLNADSLHTLKIYGVGEILIKDPRVADVAVQNDQRTAGAALEDLDLKSGDRDELLRRGL